MNEVLTALEEQVTCYRRLAKLADAQHEHVQQMHMEPLLEVLQLRQAVLNQLRKLEDVIRPQKPRWQDFLGELTEEQRSRAEAIVVENRELLQQITSADRNDALVLQQKKLSLGKQINQASSARQVNRTYATAAYGTRPARMDVQR